MRSKRPFQKAVMMRAGAPSATRYELTMMFVSSTTRILGAAPPFATDSLLRFERKGHALVLGHVDALGGLLEVGEEGVPVPLPLLIHLDRHDCSNRLTVALDHVGIPAGNDLIENLAQVPSHIKRPNF